ncbi:adenylyl cyclase X E-like isoform X9 [Drosophila albomicans]|uniref:adenylate cyclase n=1 Tax=Drosophila albomicans TaxID=7291 RepID=A0A9C6T5M1_DROAB|nr:adenylyl cyclase X E-like isoform X2 [Drosophila albomicans]XP_051861886.1 adenylyl cyclase X E-like isoform X3 [Drosophila albomicans]XP_051861888.1 adenylyl cyclase X E-like isoform X5 [Drosophila albomicans]XP_051861890.1 adenylyl cyclase X E-like isoform X7 [Drosophila albomicans]XP_051861892.1 adenylyl cyclase X E-like isoform X9 [Drosophila albomicans]
MQCELDYTNERRWEGSYLKKKCMEIGVEDEYNLYQSRLRSYYTGVYILLHWIVILVHSLFLLATCEETHLIYIDIFAYVLGSVLITAVMWINFEEELVIRRVCVMYVTSVITVLILVIIDIITNMYHYHKHDWVTGSFYDTYIILTTYMFLPIPHILPPLALGSTVSCLYVCYYFYYVAALFRNDFSNARNFNKMWAEVSHHISLNMLGVFFRISREIVVRSSFLDRHQYVMEDISLRNARAQEKIFLHSILPQQIAQPIQDDIRNRIAMAEKHRDVHIVSMARDRLMSIQTHPDVSILYADIVNYTQLTTTLTVKHLVTLLHNLYARFDKAASHFTVQRIKFLGDCYYCVAGLTVPDPDHAKCCVDLGLCMINQIQQVGISQNLDIDIRVGVHSGSLFAGVLGAAKLQYDIWGTDVTIANRLEATGMAGHIHLSARTLNSMTDHSYTILPGTVAATEDPYLMKYKIVTFLIAATTTTDEISEYESDEVETLSLSLQLSAKSHMSVGTYTVELHNEFKQMPVGPMGFRSWLKRICYSRKDDDNSTDHAFSSIRFYFLDFIDPRMEHAFLRQPDYMLKYSILLAWIICTSLIVIELVYQRTISNTYVFVSSGAMLSFTILLFITWYKKICFWRYPEGGHTYSIISCLIFRIAENIQRSLIKRVAIYMFTVTTYFGIISVMLMECNVDEYQMLHIESKIYLYEPEPNMCFQPWVLTNMICLIMGMSLIFSRIPFVMKLMVTLLEVIIYMVLIFYQFNYIVHHSLSTNPYFLAEYSHCILILITFLSLCLMERQTEFNDKMNFKWRAELKKKQKAGSLADQSISILLHNILPAHVVNIYLSSLAKHELYYEDYSMVGVMFATLMNFQLDLSSLRVLNEIITEFDNVLSYYKDDYLVEKIKIVGCTYMAACGLDIRLSSTISGRRSTRSSIAQEVARARRTLQFYEQHGHKKEDVVFVITAFALDLIRSLYMCNSNYKNLPCDRELFSAKMRVGISSGEVMAGVVGASQVHYDIWGNAVNMASRMDSTGVVGHIQVTDETATILRKCGIKCDFRGLTFVKGRGILPTYFVGIDDHYNFQYIEEDEGSFQVNVHNLSD